MQLEKLRLNFSSRFHMSSDVDIDGCGLFSLCELRLYFLLEVFKDAVLNGLSWLPLISG